MVHGVLANGGESGNRELAGSSATGSPRGKNQGDSLSR
jgi:hypothetical protein